MTICYSINSIIYLSYLNTNSDMLLYNIAWCLCSQIFVVTKLWKDSHGADKCKQAFRDSLSKLNTGHVDLYLIHTPMGGDILNTYDAMLELKAEGLIRSVGVSNFGVQHLEGLRLAGRPAPSTNQFELHPMQVGRVKFVSNLCGSLAVIFVCVHNIK